MLNWKLLWKKAKLEKFDYTVCAIVGIILALLIVVASLTGTESSYAVKQTLGTSVNEKISNILYWLDSFEMANSVATFLFWGGVGFVLYIGVSAVIGMTKEVSYEQELGSDEYVHPATKSRKDIISAEITGAVLLGACFVLLLATMAIFLFLVLPALVVNARAFTLQPTMQNALSFSAALVVCIASLCLIWFAGKLAMHRRVALDT